jgi:DNA-binding GntR family transcriptional regulator
MTAEPSRLDSLEPLERETTASIIADRIREAIMDGILEPGSQLVEAELASRFRVSRGPVREATQRLIQEGLLRNERFRGVFVTKLEADEIRDLYLARRAIEHAAVEALVRDPSSDQVLLLKKLVAQMRRAASKSQWADVVALDLAFHEALVTASGSQRLLRMFRTLVIETSVCIAALVPAYAGPSALAEEHASLVEAIETGHTKRALRLLDEHLDSAVQDLTAAEGSEPPASASPAAAEDRS